MDYIYKRDSGAGKPTYTLRVGPNSWNKIKNLFDSAGRPLSDDIKRIKIKNRSWELHAQPFIMNDIQYHKIYGVCGDLTFGNAPTYYQQAYRGHLKIAKQIFDMFIDKYLKDSTSNINEQKLRTLIRKEIRKIIK